jgi:hypothetical protein
VPKSCCSSLASLSPSVPLQECPTGPPSSDDGVCVEDMFANTVCKIFFIDVYPYLDNCHMNRDNHIMLKCWQHCVINVPSTMKDMRCGLINRENSVILTGNRQHFICSLFMHQCPLALEVECTWWVDSC